MLSRSRLSPLSAALMLVVLFGSLVSAANFQETVDATKDGKKKVRRLPTYYAKVVTQKQREQIYDLQDKFDADIEALQSQISEKMKERDEAIASLLTPEQAAEVKRMTDEASAKRAASKKSKEETAEGEMPSDEKK